ncbi:type II toxin-antitoxin system prevent-host-death family antitoxin [Sphingomonas crocodyli]|uniref:Antitoxin n=2 Tax=Sphingomonas crocodyli TaxID=1979270 RepID=A0A437LV44_9SPHN|nr:type II toxin-antitoxin system prevent-host-death family antitoxin [Sphingomonas crocodyli]
MTIHVNIGEAKTRLSELVAAAVRGEEVILAKAGEPQVRLVAIPDARDEEREKVKAKRRAAFGMFREELAGYDLSLENLKADRDPERRERKLLGPDL